MTAIPDAMRRTTISQVVLAGKFVSTTGNNGAAGSEAAPWATIGFGISQLSAGETLWIRAGTYVESIEGNGQLIPNGSAGNPTIIRGYPGETVILRPSAGQRGLRLVGRSYISFYDLTFNCELQVDASNSEGMNVNSSNHILWDRVRVLNSYRSGILMNYAVATVPDAVSGNNTFRRGEIDGCGQLGGGGQSHGFYVSSGPGNVIEDSNIHHSGAYGIHLQGSSGTTGTLNDNIFRRNLLHHNGVTYAFGAGIVINHGLRNKVQNNFVYANDWGVQLLQAAVDTQVDQNTVTGNGPSGGIVIETGGTGALIRNNISWNNTGGNITDNGSGTSQSTNQTTDPTFVNAGADDYRIQASSSAKNAGTNLAGIVDDDYFGTARPQGGSYDIGAHEFV